MMKAELLTRHQVAARWRTSLRTVDRKRLDGLLAWIDLSGGRGRRPQVRFRLADIEEFEQRMRRIVGDLQ